MSRGGITVLPEMKVISVRHMTHLAEVITMRGLKIRIELELS